MTQVVADFQTLLRQSGKAQFVALADLKVDRSYQPEGRQRRSRVKPMAEAWKQVLVGALLVSLRTTGDLWIIDGATRHGAALLRNEMVRDGTHTDWPIIPGFWCIIHTGLSVADEAQMFEELNGPGRLAVHVVDRYAARLLYQDPIVLAIQKALDVWDIRVTYSPGPKAISAVQALEHLLGWGVLEETLEIVETAWPETPAAHQRNILLGVGAFELAYRNHPGYSREDVSAVLFDESPMRLVREALSGAVRPSTYTGRSAWASVAASIREEVNAGLGKGQRLPPFVQPNLPRAQQRISRPPENRRRSA